MLYNLSFEPLTPQPIASFKDLASKSLLAKYAVSYNYSLFNLGEEKPANTATAIIAFAPGFSDDLKRRYRTSTHSTPVEMKSKKLTAGWWIGGGTAILFLTAILLAMRKQAGNKKRFGISRN